MSRLRGRKTSVVQKTICRRYTRPRTHHLWTVYEELVAMASNLGIGKLLEYVSRIPMVEKSSEDEPS
jgi:hypothetical protein